MTIDLTRLRAIVAGDYTVAIESHYAEPGMLALRRLAPALDQIHEELAYELLPNGLTVMAGLESSNPMLPAGESMLVTPAQLPDRVRGGAAIEVRDDGGLVLYPNPVDPYVFADAAVVYHFDGVDNFVIEGELLPVPNPTTFPSVWGTPTFFSLDEALRDYRDRIALRCRCPHLQGIWHDPDRRWILKNKPEDAMQASLYQYLISSLRDHKKIETRREQPVGGKKPPDIKVTWTLTNRIAFIEVKWMGASAHPTEPRISWKPNETDANKGAYQLIGYLDENASDGTGYQTMGFLVVFDGRRAGVRFDTEELSYDDALHYLAREVFYDPDYSTIRHDVAQPMRFFMYPLAPAC